jgi:hypothetical protein
MHSRLLGDQCELLLPSRPACHYSPPVGVGGLQQQQRQLRHGSSRANTVRPGQAGRGPGVRQRALARSNGGSDLKGGQGNAVGLVEGLRGPQGRAASCRESPQCNNAALECCKGLAQAAGGHWAPSALEFIVIRVRVATGWVYMCRATFCNTTPYFGRQSWRGWTHQMGSRMAWEVSLHHRLPVYSFAACFSKPQDPLSTSPQDVSRSYTHTLHFSYTTLRYYTVYTV